MAPALGRDARVKQDERLLPGPARRPVPARRPGLSRPAAPRRISRRDRHARLGPVAVRPRVEEGIGKPGRAHRERQMARVYAAPAREDDDRPDATLDRPDATLGRPGPARAAAPEDGAPPGE